MKEDELRKHTTCSICGKKLGQTGIPMFWVIKAQRYGLDFGALQRQQGLTMMMGGSATLARVMGPDEDMASELTEEITVTVCENCAFNNPIRIGAVALETAAEEEESDDG